MFKDFIQKIKKMPIKVITFYSSQYELLTSTCQHE